MPSRQRCASLNESPIRLLKSQRFAGMLLSAISHKKTKLSIISLAPPTFETTRAFGTRPASDLREICAYGLEGSGSYCAGIARFLTGGG